jgi:predicted enzyme related to lactoylglutathione lyase
MHNRKEHAMPERDGYLPGVPCWVDSSQPDPDAAAAFYRGLFGWQTENTMPPGSEAKYLVARLRGGDVAAISSPPDGAQGPPAWNTYIWVDSADETTAKVREAGGNVMAEPLDVFGAGRMAVFSDPEGAVFSVWQAREHRGARIVNEPGALNFNGLNTRDVDRAQSFYSAVFGWGTLSLPSGQMWTLPGYGDYLEALTPGIRAMTAQFGTPGFEDVVAAIIPIAGDDSATPAHWNVTFGTDDADAAAARAAGLGGEVLVPPSDGPFVRMTVLRDPQGAAFTASKFVPENKDLA